MKSLRWIMVVLLLGLLPAGVVPGGVLTWTVLLGPGGAWTYTVAVTVAPHFAGLLSNAVWARGARGGEITAVCTVVVPPRPYVLPLVFKGPPPPRGGARR